MASVEIKCKQTLFSAQYVKSGFTGCGVRVRGVCGVRGVRGVCCVRGVRGVRGDLSLVVDGFRCIRCDGTIEEADISEDLVVDGDGCVKSFYYLGDTPDGDGGADLAATGGIRNGELFPFLPFLPTRDERYASCVRITIIYGS